MIRKRTGVSALLATLFGAALLFALTPVLRADVVHLNTGGVIRGTILAENEDEVEIETLGGTITVFREDIERIERIGKEDPKKVFAKKRKQVKDTDLQSLFELAEWCGMMKLETQRVKTLEEIIAQKPSHLGARMALGYVLRRGEWVTALAAAKIDDQLLVGPSEDDDEGASVERALTEDLESVAKKRIGKGLKKAVTSLSKDLRSKDKAKREAAFEALLAIPDGYADTKLAEEGLLDDTVRRGELLDEGYVAVRATLSVLAASRARTYKKNLKRLAKSIPNLDSDRYNKARDKYLKGWIATRDEAVDTIFDLEIYPDENHGIVGQPTVDEKVEKVIEVYGSFERLLLDDLRVYSKLPKKQAEAFLAGLEGIRDLHTEVANAIEQAGGQAPDDLQEPRPVFTALLLYRAERIKEAYAIKPRLSAWEQVMFQRLHDVRVREYNDSVLNGKPPEEGEGKLPTLDERNQVLITNEYRIMMGRVRSRPLG
ncbi:MAG: hypothetical protein ACYS22_18895 [Planctomycetota bacterium]|jgi:hypothetical protein